MDANEKTLNLFSTRVRQMILQFKETKTACQKLNKQVEEKNAQIKQLQEQLAQAQRDYDSLKMAKMIEITDGDIEEAKKRVQALIRDVDKCITLLSGK
jgi:chromosome segregation ATPase